MTPIHLCKLWAWGTTKQVSLTAFWVIDDSQTTCPKPPLEADTLSSFSHWPWGTIRRTLTILAPFLLNTCYYAVSFQNWGAQNCTDYSAVI